MSAGTLTLTNNSDIVTGIGTSFATELDAGDFVVVTVGGVPYTLPVKSVESDTDLTLVSNFTGPTQSGAAWSAVPRVALNMVTAALVAQSAEALRGLNYDKQNWQQVFSAAGNITVKLPDGTTFTGPSWKYLSDNMATKSGGAVPVNQGGTGSTSASGARTNLGLGTAALLDGSYLAMTNKGNTFSDNLAVRKSASYASFSLTSLSNNEDAVGSTNLIEMAGGDPGATPLFYIARRNRINSVGQWVINFPAAGGTLALAGTSDINFKCDIEEFDGQESVEKILALELRKFKYIDDEKRRVRRGIIAQQAELVEPLYVKHTREPDGTEEFDEEGNKITHGYRERLVLDNNAIILDLLCALQVAMKTIHRHEERLASLEQAMKAFTTSGSGKYLAS